MPMHLPIPQSKDAPEILITQLGRLTYTYCSTIGGGHLISITRLTIRRYYANASAAYSMKWACSIVGGEIIILIGVVIPLKEKVLRARE